MTDTTSSNRKIAATVAELPGSAAERFGDALAARYKVGDEWRELSYAEFGSAIEQLGLGLIDVGIERGDRVCLLSDTRVEWTLASYAISVAGAVVVPIYPSSSLQECKWVASNSEARAIVCENDDQLAKIDPIRAELPELAHTIGIEHGGQLTLDSLRERGGARHPAELSARQAGIAPGDTYTIIYTSGTTGPPKGVVLTHANAMAVCRMVQEVEFIRPDELTYQYLPLAHSFALTAQLASFDRGSAVVYWGRDTGQILPEIMETRPTYLPSVPRIFEKLYAAAMKMQEQASEEERERFRQAIKLGVEVRRRRQRGEPVPEEMRRAFEPVDAQIFERVRALWPAER